MLKADPTSTLFEQADGFSKYLLLTRVEGIPADDPIVRPLTTKLTSVILDSQKSDGSWSGTVYLDYFTGTTKQLMRLGELGYTEDDPQVGKALDYISAHQLPNGSIGEEPSVRTAQMCPHHFTGNMCISLDSLRGLNAIKCTRKSLMQNLIRWVLSWQQEHGEWWSPGSKNREMRGKSGKPGCGLWLTCWALLALANHSGLLEADAKRRAIDYLLKKYGTSGAIAWKQSPDEFMWCSVGVRMPDKLMEGVVTGTVLYALTMNGCDMSVPEVEGAVRRLLELQGRDGFWRAGHPRLDGWLTLVVMVTLARLHGLFLQPVIVP